MAKPDGPAARLLAPFHGRRDSEHEQALIRIVLGLLLVGYLIYAVLADGVVDGTERELLVAVVLFMTGAFGILAWIARDPLPMGCTSGSWSATASATAPATSTWPPRSASPGSAWCC
jgi:hypothetical protein